MNIGFTGHRNRRTAESELDRLFLVYPGATWVHGDHEKGFDAQVKAYAIAHGIPQTPIKPKYRFWPDREAPLIRNQEIVHRIDLLVACYDGVRMDGGTIYTIRYAESQYVPIVYVECVRL